MRIIGIDPGSIKTGYGVIDTDGSKTSYVASGVIDTKKDSFNERLKVIFESLSEIIKEHQPNQMAIESVFVHKNANSALKLGHARAAAICASFESDINVFEYSPRAVSYTHLTLPTKA